MPCCTNQDLSRLPLAESLPHMPMSIAFADVINVRTRQTDRNDSPSGRNSRQARREKLAELIEKALEILVVDDDEDIVTDAIPC